MISFSIEQLLLIFLIALSMVGILSMDFFHDSFGKPINPDGFSERTIKIHVIIRSVFILLHIALFVFCLMEHRDMVVCFVLTGIFLFIFCVLPRT